MPWLETAPMKERIKFIGLALSEMYTMSELCSRSGIGRKTGYKWVERYAAGGENALADRSRKPHFSPQRARRRRSSCDRRLRKRHPTWAHRNCSNGSSSAGPSSRCPRRARSAHS